MKDSFASVSAARWLTALAMMSGAAPALACPPGEDDNSEGVELLHVTPRVTVQAHGVPILRDLPLVAMGSQSRVRLIAEPSTNFQSTHTIDDKTYEVKVQDGKITAKIDGKAVPESQIRTTDDQIELLDADGNVVHSFSKDIKTTVRLRARQAPAADHALFPGGRLRIEATQPAEIKMPPVMMGITMSEAADQNGLGVVVDKVMDGLPASKAGLRMGDKVLEVNGTEVEDVLTFREFLSERKAGEEITLKVLRDGTARDVKVTLDAYNEETLKPLIKELEASAPKGLNLTPTRNDSAKDAIKAAIKRLEATDMSDDSRKAAMETLTKALSELDAAKAQQGQWRNNEERRVYGMDKDGSFVITAPRANAAAARADELAAKIDLLSARLDTALAMIKEQQAKSPASPESLDLAKAKLVELQRENEALRKKVEELQTKRGGN